MKQEELIKSCGDLLYKLCDLVESRNTLNYYDINISSEYFFIPLLNRVFDCDLRNINTEKKNAEAIDLYDTNGNVAIQVTSNSSPKKIRTTLENYRSKRLYEQYKRLIVIVIVRSHTFKADFSEAVHGEFSFSKTDDIFTMNSLIRAISALRIERIADIKEYLEYQLETMLDKTQVLSISQSFEYISQNTNNILGESFFEIDSEMFITAFQEKLKTSDVIHLSSVSLEEGKYCILNLLHKLAPGKRVYVIKSKVNWDKADKYLSDCILIPEFLEDEIPASRNNITIFIQDSNQNRNAIRIPRRTISFLSNKLLENGYNDPYRLLQKTHSLYYYIKKELFTGKTREAKWEKDNNRAVIVASLLGMWTECDGDKKVIEKLYGEKYEHFISYLDQYMGVEDAFVVRRNSMRYHSDIVFEIAYPLHAVYSHSGAFNLPIITEFIGLAKTVVSEKDPSIGKSFEERLYISTDKTTEYSVSIKSGLTRTLIFLALYTEFQPEINSCVEELLASIQSVKDWVQRSRFIEALCEAAPGAVLDCIEKGIDNHNGLIDLFTADKSDAFIVNRYYYSDILCCLERLLTCKEYSVRSARALLEIRERVGDSLTGGYIRDEVEKVFSTLHNVCALGIGEKIELARIGVGKYAYLWDILYDEIGQNAILAVNSGFMYRQADEIVAYSQEDRHTLYISYTRTLLSNTENNLERLVKLLDLLPACTDELFNDIQNKFASSKAQLGDSEKERVKTSLRKIIYKHRRFANSEWAASPERVSKIETMCEEIDFNDPAYDFLYLTESGDVPILHPAIYNSNIDDYKENKKRVENAFSSEMKRLKDMHISLRHFLGLRKIESYHRIGAAIAKYYCDSKYDEKILDDIITSSDNPQLAVRYVMCCSSHGLSEVYKVLAYLRTKHYADKYYIAFLSVLPFDEESRVYILDLPEQLAQNYWRNFSQYKFATKDLLNDVIRNLFMYKNWDTLLLVMHEQENMLSIEEILGVLMDVLRKINAEKYQIGNGESYYINELISAIHQRIGKDFDNYPILYELEMYLFEVIHWENMKCSQYFFKRNAKLYADILSKAFIKDDGSSDESIDLSVKNHYYSSERRMSFCPGEENGSINPDVLNEWISVFRSQLERQGQSSLFYRKLGKLFACSPTGSDDLFPHEIIREKIEEIGNQELINAFASAIIYGRGLHNITAGVDEYRLSQKYGEMSRKLAVRYPETSKALSMVSKMYKDESEHERRIAENDIY